MMCTNVKRGISLSSASSASSASKPYADCQVGDHFFYGSYPQGKNGEIKPIEWRVLARESDRLLVIAEYALDGNAYNEEWVDTNWSQCTLRSWLNGEFMNKAFTAEERGNLMEVTLNNSNRPKNWDNVPGGPDTCDKVFLLSMDEVQRYFSGDDERCCKATAYAVEQGSSVLTEDEFFEDVAYACNSWWWLRSLGTDAHSAAGVDSDGDFNDHCVDDDHGALRPAAYLAL